MYNVIYDEMVDASIAERLVAPIFTDRDGNEVEESQRFGLKQGTKITRPEYLLFADETGCSTSQKKDGQVGGTKYLCKKGTTPQMMACTNDHRFTVLPFTSGSGEAVCCAVIFQSKTGEVLINCKSGVDIRSDDPLRNGHGEIDFETNTGEGKYFPGGPKCVYNGKEIDCLTFASASGGISGDILVKYFDKHDIFPCEAG